MDTLIDLLVRYGEGLEQASQQAFEQERFALAKRLKAESDILRKAAQILHGLKSRQ